VDLVDAKPEEYDMQTVTLGDHGATIGQLAVAWVLAHPAVQVAIVGARTPAHLDESAGAAELRLSQDDLTEIDRIMSATVPVGGPSPEGMT
jgi:hypothetical protein